MCVCIGLKYHLKTRAERDNVMVCERLRILFFQKGKSSKQFMESCDKFGFTKQIFSGLKLQKPYPNVKDHILFLSSSDQVFCLMHISLNLSFSTFALSITISFLL